MTQFNKFSLATLLFLFVGLIGSQAQRPVVLSTGGSYTAPDSYVKIYSYHPDKDTVYIQDSIPGDFSNDVLYDGEYYYLHVGRASGNPAGGDAIYQYDEHSFDVVDSIQPISGAQSMAVRGDHLVITRAYAASSEFVRVYNRNNLSAGPTYAKDSIDFGVTGLTIRGDSAYVGGTENDSGRIARLDLSMATPTFDTIYEMDTMSAGIGSLVQDSDDIYALSERYDAMNNFLYAAVTQFDPATGSYSTDTNSYGSRSPVMARNDSVWLNIDNPLNVYDAATGNFPQEFPVSHTSGTFNANADRFYFQRTNYFSTGDFLITDAGGTRIDSFSTDISGTAVTLADSVRVMAGTDTTICADADMMVQGSASTDSGMWMSSGSGSFTDPTSLTTTYMPSSADTSGGSVQISLVTMDTGRFRPDTSTFTLSFKSVPIVNAGPDQNVCASEDTVALSGSVGGAVTSSAWMSMGDGEFEDSLITGTDYYPGSNDSTSGSVSLVLAATNGGDCPVTDTVSIAIDKIPESDISFGPQKCAGNDPVDVSATSNTGSGEWSSSGSGSFADSAALSTTYSMSSMDTSNGKVSVSFANTNVGGCEADTSMATLIAVPVVDAGSDISTTVGAGPVNLNGSADAADQWEWTTYGSGSFGDKSKLSTSYDPSQADEDLGSVNLKLTAMNDSTCSNSDVVNVDFTDTHVAEREDENASLKLRPVPADERLIVNSSDIDGATTAEYAIIDLTGRVVQEGRVELGGEEELQLEGLHEGSYFLRIRSENTEFVRKWMKR